MEATLRAILDDDGVDGGVLERLTGAAQCYRAIRVLANLSKCGPGLQEVSLDRAEQGRHAREQVPRRRRSAYQRVQQLGA